MKIKKLIFLVVLITLIPTYTYGFSDIESNWYKESIEKLKEDGVVNGFEDGGFHPDNKITRAEVLAIIFNSNKTEIKEHEGDICFPDLKKGWWYVKYICYAHKNNITSGYGDGTFRPNGNVSVLELLALGLQAYQVDLPEKASGEQWYDRIIKFADDNNIIPKNAYTINTPATRGQAAEIIVGIQAFKAGEKLDYKSMGCNNKSNSLSEENTITINGVQRSYLLSIPNNYSASKTYPLVLGLHGRTNSNYMVRDYMGIGGGKWGKTVEETITVYPAGLGSGPYTWHQAENIDFIDALLTQVSESLCIDKSKVHIVGHSLGGYFSNKLSCLRGDIISTMTSVGSGGYNGYECRGPVASFLLHNKDDHLVPYSDGKNALNIRKSVNSCSGDPKNINISGLSCQKWDDCSAGNPVVFCSGYSTYLNDPHSWPKQGASGIFEFIGSMDR